MKLSDDLVVKSEHESLEALLLSVEEGPDAALTKLKGRNDPASIKRQLIILLRNGREGEAADLVIGKNPDESWCALAIQACVLGNRRLEGDRFFGISRQFSNRIKRDQCAFAFAESLFKCLGRDWKKNSILSPQTLEPDKKAELLRVWEVLALVFSRIEATQIIENEFEQSVTELALQVAFLLGEKTRSNSIVKLLAKRTPIPLLVGRAVLANWVDDMPANLSDRLLSEHPDSFDAGLMAASVQGHHEGRRAVAFETAKTLIQKATSPDQKSDLWHILRSLAEKVGNKENEFLEEKAAQILSGNQFELALWEAEKLLRIGETNDARKLLEKNRRGDNFLWLQLWADLMLQLHETAEVLSAVQQLVKVFPHRDSYAKAAQAALSLDELDAAAEFLHGLLRFSPSDIVAHTNLAFIFSRREDYKRAAHEFRKLSELQPDQPTHLINEAISRELDGDIESSLRIYESLCAKNDPPLQALLGRAKILRARDKAEEAFKSLKSFKQQYWDDPRFVSAYMDLAYAAQDEAAAHEALLRLKEFQNQGKISDVLRPVSFDEIKGHIQEFQKKKEQVLSLNLQGTLPWLLVEEFLGRVPLWGWALRTQKVDWLSEFSLILAEHSVYATNSFHVQGPTGGRELDEIKCPPKGTAIVVDLTALISLSQLGFLNEAADYFGKILYPASYSAHILEESSRLVLNQKSQKTSLQDIKSAIERGAIKVLENIGMSNSRPFAFVHEHTLDDAEHVYRLKDIATTLHGAGRITDKQHVALLSVAHKSSGVDADHLGLKISQSILVDLSTLKTLHNGGFLPVLHDAFDVHISAGQRDEVYRDMRGFEAFGNVHGWHTEMWRKIQSDRRFVQILEPKEAGSPKVENKRDVYLSAPVLAHEQKMPLLVDDRVCQVVAFNEQRDIEFPSFGTDQVLIALAREKLISDDQLADAFLKLISWRYRFLLVPAKVLLTIARRYSTATPGASLQQVAKYVHECMRDPGLMYGVEPSDPPSVIGVKFYYAWATTVVNFLADAWSDNSLEEDKVKTLTIWAIQELLPAPPRSMGPVKSEAITSLLPRIVMANAFISSVRIQDHTKANRALLTIADALGVRQTDYFVYLTDVIYGT